MDRRLSTSFWRPKETIHRRTGLNDARPNETFPNWNGRVKIRNRSCPNSIGFKRRQTSRLLYIENILTGGMKLWDLWQGTSSDHSSFGRMATPYPRITTHDGCTIGSQKPHVLSRSKETQSTTSTLVIISFRIRCKISTHPRKQDDSIGRTF